MLVVQFFMPSPTTLRGSSHSRCLYLYHQLRSAHSYHALDLPGRCSGGDLVTRCTEWARRRRLKIFPEHYCPEEEVQPSHAQRSLPRGRCRANVGVFFLGALLMQRVGDARRCAHLYLNCPELLRVFCLAHRCSCIQNLLQGGTFVQDASGSLHGSEICSSFMGSCNGHHSAPAYVGLCDWCLFQRLDEVETGGCPMEDPRNSQVGNRARCPD